MNFRTFITLTVGQDKNNYTISIRLARKKRRKKKMRKYRSINQTANKINDFFYYSIIKIG